MFRFTANLKEEEGAKPAQDEQRRFQPAPLGARPELR
jgi:hypothetical protein